MLYYVPIITFLSYMIGFLNKRFLKTSKRIFNFTKIFYYIAIMSGCALVYSIYSLSMHPTEMSIEFIGGRNLKIEFKSLEQYENIKKEISEIIPSASISKIENTANLKYSSKFLHQDKVINEILAKEEIDIISDYGISGSLSEEMKYNSLLTLFFTLLFIGIYIWFTFNIQYAIGAIIALVHDITISAFFIQFFEYEISTYTITALLIILGYSINDTVVIFDKLRHNMKFHYSNLDDVINRSISSTLSRTIMTSISTIIPILITYAMVSEILRPMMMILIIGFIAGTYSSIFIASPIIKIFFNKTNK